MASIKELIELQRLKKLAEVAEVSSVSPNSERSPRAYSQLNTSNNNIVSNLPQASPSSSSSALAKLIAMKASNEKSKEISISTANQHTASSKNDPSIQEHAEPISSTIPSDSSVLEKITPESHITHTTDKNGATITYNAKQSEFVSLVSSGASCILIGAAGTGKTTSQKGATQALIQNGRAGILTNHDHKYLPQGVPGIVVCAYTRRAVNNIRKNLSADMQGNAITIHKLLEYEPVYSELFDEKTGRTRNTMTFMPARNADYKLPSGIRVIIFEESSMIAVELYNEVIAALPPGVQIIFLGDIQQLPPVFGSAILGFKMLELPCIELTEVYRQALESPIIRLAHRILSGVPIRESEFQDWHFPSQLHLHPWKKKISADAATITLSKFFLHNLSTGGYNPETDAILIPFNKSCGTDELNKHIAGAIAVRDSKPVWEIIHGFKKSYLSVGDKCLYDKEDCIIENIYANPEYTGAAPQSESCSLNYFGHKTGVNDDTNSSGSSEWDADSILAQVSAGGESDDTVRAASHVITLRLLDSEREVKIKSAGELNNLILGYAITFHKSQGSEWKKVFLCLHASHNTMLCRELLYTGVTRAREELFIICEPDQLIKGIEVQRIKGNTIAEKSEFFKGKQDRKELQS